MSLQITTKRINFIVDKAERNPIGNGFEYSSENQFQEKDQSWLISLLHQIYSRRLDEYSSIMGFESVHDNKSLFEDLVFVIYHKKFHYDCL